MIDRMRSSRVARPLVAGVVLILVGVLSKGSLSPYNINLFTTILLYATVAVAWNILGGYGGMFSLGSSAFVGVGAYGVGVSMVHWGFGYLPALGASVGISLIIAVLLSIPLLRLRGDYFTIGTLAITLALQAFITNWSYAGQSDGLTLPQQRVPLPDTLYIVAVLMAGAALLVSILAHRTPFGLRLTAVRDDQDAASSLGVTVFRHRLAALLIFSALTGLAGGLLALQNLFIEPTGTFSITWTLNAVLMCTIGGMATLVGPWLGTIVVYYLITKQLESHATIGVLIEGALLIIIVRLAPEGLWPLFLRLWHWIVSRFRGSTGVPAEGEALPTQTLISPATGEIEADRGSVPAPAGPIPPPSLP
jgi:branched-chain amino acid transport system permease protein